MKVTLAARLAALERRRRRLIAIEMMSDEELQAIIDPHAAYLTDEQLRAIINAGKHDGQHRDLA